MAAERVCYPRSAAEIPIFHPEDHARAHIDDRLAAAGWLVQSRAQTNLGADAGVAVREFATAAGPVDYALFVGRVLCGVIEAKPAGTTLSGFADQAARYIADVPQHLVRREGQVRFEDVSSGNETLFRDHADPAPRSPAPQRRLGFFLPAAISVHKLPNCRDCGYPMACGTQGLAWWRHG
jgi:type I site-specific restriction endonuclease